MSLGGPLTIRYQAHMGSDLNVVNAARASMRRESLLLTARDAALIRDLAADGHESPFRHVAIRFLVTSTLRDRLRWEGVENRAGMVFVPQLTDLADTEALDSLVRWRWTASLPAAVRLVQANHRGPLADVAGRVAARLELCWPESAPALLGYQATPRIRPALRGSDVVQIRCLDQGYVRLVDSLHGPTAAETVVSLEIKAPYMVRAQWWKYQRRGEQTPPLYRSHPWEEEGSGNGEEGPELSPLHAINAQSGRYRQYMGQFEPEFYVPVSFRSASAERRQGSGATVAAAAAAAAAEDLRATYAYGLAKYRANLDQGLAPEQQRLHLNYHALYVTWRWTATLPEVVWFLQQRLRADAQGEIQEYATAVRRMVEPLLWPEQVAGLLAAVEQQRPRAQKEGDHGGGR